MAETSPTRTRLPSSRIAPLLIAFAIHLIAWTAFCSLKTATLGSDLGAWSGYALCAFALIALVAAVLIVRREPPLPRIIITVVIVAAYGISGIAEAAYSLVPSSQDSWVWTIGQPFPYAATLIVPFLIAAAVLRRAHESATADRLAVPNQPVPANRASGFTLIATVLVLVFSPLLSSMMATAFDWDSSGIALSALVSAVAFLGLLVAIVALRAYEKFPPGGTATTIYRIAGFVALVCGMHLCILATATRFDTIGTGIGDILLLLCAFAGYVIGATYLGIVGPQLRSRLATASPDRFIP